MGLAEVPPALLGSALGLISAGRGLQLVSNLVERALQGEAGWLAAAGLEVRLLFSAFALLALLLFVFKAVFHFTVVVREAKTAAGLYAFRIFFSFLFVTALLAVCPGSLFTTV
jgi:hypothetical protein